MCHLILLLPLFGLPLFWLLPVDVALPAYVGLSALSVAAYLVVIGLIRLPVVTGREALLHATGRVQALDGSTASVWINGELWSASGEHLSTGDLIEVVSINGLMLKVRKLAGLRDPAAMRDKLLSCH